LVFILDINIFRKNISDVNDVGNFTN